VTPRPVPSVSLPPHRRFTFRPLTSFGCFHEDTFTLTSSSSFSCELATTVFRLWTWSRLASGDIFFFFVSDMMLDWKRLPAKLPVSRIALARPFSALEGPSLSLIPQKVGGNRGMVGSGSHSTLSRPLPRPPFPSPSRARALSTVFSPPGLFRSHG